MKCGTKRLEAKLKAFRVWFDGLSEHDRNNFLALVNLSNASSLVASLPEGQFRNMATLALAIKEVTATE